MVQTLENLVVGRGRLLFNRFAPRTLIGDGFRPFGNTPDISLTQASTKLPHYNSDRALKELDRSVQLQSDMTGKFSTDVVSAPNLALFFLGVSELTTVAAVAAPGITETIVVKKGLGYQLGEGDDQPGGSRNLTTLVVKIGGTLVPATNYNFNGPAGFLEINEDAADIDDGDSLVLTYGQAAYSSELVISKGQQIEGALKFIADNAEGLNRDFLAPYVQITAQGDYAWKGDTWQNMSFSVDVLKRTDMEKLYISGRGIS